MYFFHDVNLLKHPIHGNVGTESLTALAQLCGGTQLEHGPIGHFELQVHFQIDVVAGPLLCRRGESCKSSVGCVSLAGVPGVNGLVRNAHVFAHRNVHHGQGLDAVETAFVRHADTGLGAHALNFLLGHIQAQCTCTRLFIGGLFVKAARTFDIRRGIDNKGKVVATEEMKPTLRYIYLNGNKADKKKMLKDMKMLILPYPKGQNKNYDCIDINMTYQMDFFI
jgi:hypothetical protein